MLQISFQLPSVLAETLLSKADHNQRHIDEIIEFALVRYLGEQFD